MPTTGNKVSFAISSAKFNLDAALIAGEGQAQIQTPLPQKLTALHFFAGIAAKPRRRRHATKHGIHRHKVHCSNVILLELKPDKCQSIKAKFLPVCKAEWK